jgi:acetyl-CoA carboxylase carboxyltransferase component
MKRPPFTIDLPPEVERMRVKLIEYLRTLVEAVNAAITEVDPTVTDVTGAYSVKLTDRVIQVAPSAPCTVTLPLATKMQRKRVTVKRSNGTTHTITVQPASGTIDGSASVTLTTAWQVRHFFSDGVAWTTH